MELQKIKQLIDVLAASELAELELVEGDHRVRLVKRLGTDPARGAPIAAVAEQPSSTGLSRQPQAEDPVGGAGEHVTAPLYGVVHLKPSPDAPPFVQLGDAVQRGQTLCVVEAMKMFHQVTAHRGGTVTAILAVAGDEVEAGTPLFRLASAAKS